MSLDVSTPSMAYRRARAHHKWLGSEANKARQKVNSLLGQAKAQMGTANKLLKQAGGPDSIEPLTHAEGHNVGCTFWLIGDDFTPYPSDVDCPECINWHRDRGEL